MTDLCIDEGRSADPESSTPVVGTYPFGRPATRRLPRLPETDSAAVLVLGVYPSALHVRWARPGGPPIAALAVDDEPTVFWTGHNQAERVEWWRRQVGWRPEWGAISPAGANGGSGRLVVTDVLEPLGLDPRSAYFTDCLPTYFVKPGERQDRAIREYDEFAVAAGLSASVLRRRPDKRDLVRIAVQTEGSELLRQFRDSAAPTVVTLGKEAADVFAALTGTDRVPFRLTGEYGVSRAVPLGGREIRWIPLVHPGVRRDIGWRNCHARWVLSQRS
ncbi:hypothetical protein [Actinokineospora iranica]|uniref:Uracil DNA glycosylase superfamily protein n=1 Tax=Actinokineospora iranica TaxID=1271860 RepID=A0A1G6RW47_9PSEU|nr:hypothetical protein [Actinokineospora iranica]SDD08166.1 hypothetical protein SAMN05216174_10730 [Actinokineospora iranica]